MHRRLSHIVLLATAGFMLVRLPALPHREFDADEFEHAHAAWSLFTGLVPYKHFFEHHTPWYYYVLRPFFNCFEVDASFASATHFLLFARVLSWLLTALSLVLVYRVGRAWADRQVGLVAALLLVAQPVFLQKTFEARPDVLALPFFLGALWLLLRGLAGDRPRWFLAAGLALGAAIMCTQKMLFVLPGALLGLGVWALSARTRARALAIASFLLGVAVPVGLTWAAFAAHDAGGAFITNNFLLNAQWKHIPRSDLVKLLWSSGPVLALALWAARSCWLRFRRAEEGRHADLLLVSTMAGLFASVLVLPVAYRQYYLMPLSIACLLAARSALALAERLRPWLVALAVATMVVLPLVTLRDTFVEDNRHQLARLRRVFETTQPSDLVMDGWLGAGVFRLHAFRYFFLHEEIRAMLPAAELDAYLDALEDGRIRPRLIVVDENLRSLGPRFVSFVDRHYTTTDGAFYYAR